MRRIILLLSFLMLQLLMAQQQASPNGDVQLSFSLSANGTPTYKVSYKGKEVVKLLSKKLGNPYGAKKAKF